VAGGIDQVELVLDTRRVRVRHARRGGLDGNALFALEIHGVKQLLGHVTFAHRAGGFQQAVRQRGLAVIDVRDDAEVADTGLVHEIQCRRSAGYGCSDAARGRVRDARLNGDPPGCERL
jgi:hypothetical protein